MSRVWMGAAAVALVAIVLLVYATRPGPEPTRPGATPAAPAAPVGEPAPAVAPSPAVPTLPATAGAGDPAEGAAAIDGVAGSPAPPEVTVMLTGAREAVIAALRRCDVPAEPVLLDFVLAVEDGEASIAELAAVAASESEPPPEAPWLGCVSAGLDELRLSGPDGDYPIRLDIEAGELE